MASAPQTYKRGSQDIRNNQSTFLMFWGFTKWSVVLILLVMAFLAYMFT